MNDDDEHKVHLLINLISQYIDDQNLAERDYEMYEVLYDLRDGLFELMWPGHSRGEEEEIGPIATEMRREALYGEQHDSFDWYEMGMGPLEANTMYGVLTRGEFWKAAAQPGIEQHIEKDGGIDGGPRVLLLRPDGSELYARYRTIEALRDDANTAAEEEQN